MGQNITTCENCGKSFIGALSKCPFCGAELQKPEDVYPEKAEPEYTDRAMSTENEEYSEEPEQVYEEQEEEAPPVRKKKAAPKKRPAPVNPKRGRPQSATLKLASLILLGAMVFLAVIGGKTGIFKVDNSDKTVLFSALKGEQLTSCANFINQYSSLFEDGYDKSYDSFSLVLEKLQPESESGLLKSSGKTCEQKMDSADPAKRYEVSSSVAGYYEVEEKDVTTIAKSMGLVALKDINTDECYYCNGKYYFKSTGEASTEKKLYAVVKSSKQTNAGDYYCTCEIYDNADALADASKLTPLYTRYVLVGAKEKNSKITWSLKEISKTELYSKTGAKIEDAPTEGALQYTIKRKSFTAKTSDGKIFAKYYIEYPKFEASGIAQTACRSVYIDKINELKSRVKHADKLYQAFIDDGGNDSMLPLYTNVVITVTYNENGYFSTIQRTTEYNPLDYIEKTEEGTTSSSYYYSSEETTTEPVQAEVDKNVIPPSQYEGCSFDIESGEFLKKDVILSSGYDDITKKLNSLYGGTTVGQIGNVDSSETETTEYGENNGYSYSSTDSTETTDSSGVGSAIYNSAWAISENGMDFYYFTEAAGLKVVTIPMNELNFDQESE